jgi:hypothetical protein
VNRRGVASRAAALTILALLVASCSGSGYTYVSQTSTKTFFKVPDDWKVFRKDSVLAHPGVISGIAAKDDRFLVNFDADPKPSLKHNFLTGKFPFGVARVRALSADEQDQYSLAMLRNEVIPIDQLLQEDPKSVDVLASPRLLTHDGLRGAKLEYSVHLSDGTTFTATQVGFVDTATRNVWFLMVGCSTQCYKRHSAAIHRVIDSWTVEGK